MVCDIAAMPDIQTRLAELIAERGTNPSLLSQEIGAGREAVRMILRGSSKHPRVDTVRKLARALGVSVDYLTGTSSDRGSAPGAMIAAPATSQGLPVRYRVQAGSYYRVEDADEPSVWSRITADPRFPLHSQWVEEVVGNSIDQIYPSGSMLHVLDITEAPVLRFGQLAVVVRSVDGGMIERTVKRVVEIDNAIHLVGESSNPKWNIPFKIGSDDDSHLSISVAGVVLGGYRAEPF